MSLGAKCGVFGFADAAHAREVGSQVVSIFTFDRVPCPDHLSLSSFVPPDQSAASSRLLPASPPEGLPSLRRPPPPLSLL